MLADTLLDGRPVLRLNAADTGFALPSLEDAWDILLIDNIQDMQEERDWQALCALIRESTDRRFVLLSRGIPPACLMAFQYAGMMTVLSAEDLLFDREDIRRLLQTCGAEATDSEIGSILKETSGYPLCAAILARHMAAGQPYGAELTAQAYGEVFLYFETAVYRRFDLPIRRFLLELSPFERFDLELARMVSGDNNAAALLDTLWRSTTLLQSRDMRSYRFWPQFRQFLLWELDLEYTMEKQRALFIRGGLYYELKEDFSSALDCYTRGGDHAKVSELLIRNAELHPGMGHYAEMEQYYRALPEAEILASPSLMQGMSMLCALSADYDGSERWYGRLKQFVERCGKEDAAGRQARGRLAWLDISLPQRGVKRLTDTIPAVFQLLTNKELSLPSFSVTSALPSIMNGGKDFSPWSKRTTCSTAPCVSRWRPFSGGTAWVLRTAPSRRASLKRARTSRRGCSPCATHERHPPRRHTGHRVRCQRAAGAKFSGKRAERGRAKDHHRPAQSIYRTGTDAVSSQHGCHALPYRAAHRRSGRGRRMVPRQGAAGADAHQYSQALSVFHTGHGWSLPTASRTAPC